jgi:hypothetical protein
MSANGRVRANFESASHPDGHGANLGQASHRSGDQSEQPTVIVIAELLSQASRRPSDQN